MPKFHIQGHIKLHSVELTTVLAGMDIAGACIVYASLLVTGAVEEACACIL